MFKKIRNLKRNIKFKLIREKNRVNRLVNTNEIKE